MTDLINALLQLAAMAVLMLGGVAIRNLSDKLKLSADSEVRGYLQQTLERAVEFGQAEAKRRLLSQAAGVAPLPGGQVANVAAEIAAAYVRDRTPDALKRFGIDAAGLDQMVRARLPRPANWQGPAA